MALLSSGFFTTFRAFCGRSDSFPSKWYRTPTPILLYVKSARPWSAIKLNAYFQRDRRCLVKGIAEYEFAQASKNCFCTSSATHRQNVLRQNLPRARTPLSLMLACELPDPLEKSAFGVIGPLEPLPSLGRNQSPAKSYKSRRNDLNPRCYHDKRSQHLRNITPRKNTGLKSKPKLTPHENSTQLHRPLVRTPKCHPDTNNGSAFSMIRFSN